MTQIISCVMNRERSDLFLIRNSPNYSPTKIKWVSLVSFRERSTSRGLAGVAQVSCSYSAELGCSMKFAVFVPPQLESGPVPVIYWLSGLTCTEQNFVTKAGAQTHAAKHGFLMVAPDTSPRGLNIPGEDDSWDFGTGAGFYVDATKEPWKENYHMYSYITKELPAVIAANFKVNSEKIGIMGHSMGGHGALICALKNPGLYKSVSAFAPICNPMECPWGEKAFGGYLGHIKHHWKDYDACSLIKNYSGPPLEILIDQGTEDDFLHKGQLLPENLEKAVHGSNMALTLRMQDGYDHSYYFISSFMGDHFDHHAKYLKAYPLGMEATEPHTPSTPNAVPLPFSKN
ncbi:unnamed protein product [Meganyctiphanes norvegica]|uniref:S-formylglutathione hydrolase n=1 Tax=Meganyctiphanes norvegica TaxID=48144 RepID=A0AAV2SKF4_MEGNR